MKLIFERWRGFLAEREMPISAKKIANGEFDYISLTKSQVEDLEKFVNQFGGASIKPLLKTSKSSLSAVTEQNEPKIPKLSTSIPKKDPRTFSDFTAKDFEEGNFVLPVNKNISTSFKEMIDNLGRVEDAVEQAKSWYYDVNEIAKEHSRDENELVLLAALLGAFSHNTDFYRNLLEAIFAFKAFQFDIDAGDKECLRKYVESIQGHKVEKKFGKLKLTNFALNILDPTYAESPENFWNVTIDRWIVRAFYPGLTKKQVQKIAGKETIYIYLTRIFAEEAKKYNMYPHQLQAVIWVAIMYKERGRIDTMTPLLMRMKEQFANGLNQVEEEIRSPSEVMPRMFQSIQGPSDLRDRIKEGSSGSKRKALEIVDDKIDKMTGECVEEKLNVHYVLENYVGMRSDKKKNMKYIILQAINQNWSFEKGRDFFSGLVDLKTRRGSEIIPE